MKQLLFFFTFLFFTQQAISQENIYLADTKGNSVNAQELINNGKAKVLLFWSNYCKLCKLEMRGIRNIGQNWNEEYDAEIVFVSMETYPSDAYKKLDFLLEFKKDGVYWLHDNKLELYRHFGGQSIPFTVLLDKNGDVYQTWSAYDDGLERSIGMYFKKLKQESAADNK